MRRWNIIFAVLLAIALAIAALANGRGKLTLDLYLDWETVASPQISPDGSQIVYTRRWTDKINDKYETDIWIMNSDGSKNRFFVKARRPSGRPTASGSLTWRRVNLAEIRYGTNGWTLPRRLS